MRGREDENNRGREADLRIKRGGKDPLSTGYVPQPTRRENLPASPGSKKTREFKEEYSPPPPQKDPTREKKGSSKRSISSIWKKSSSRRVKKKKDLQEEDEKTRSKEKI